MVEDVVTLPLRIGASATRIGIRVAGLVVILGLKAAERMLEAAGPGPPEHPAAANEGDVDGSVRVDVVITRPESIHETPSAPPPTPRAEVAATAPAEATEREAALAPEPAPTHVSEGVELVESFAEPGAEDGVGAVVHIDEPWKGYRNMTANEITDRLADASREALAAVELYERVHRNRRTVLSAAERQLRRTTAAARRRQHSVSP
jgi:hypothetical protein